MEMDLDDAGARAPGPDARQDSQEQALAEAPDRNDNLVTNNNRRKRRILAHRPRRVPNRNPPVFGHQPTGQYWDHDKERVSASSTPNNRTRDNLHFGDWSARAQSGDYPETFGADMADMDIKEENGDRRDRGGYRGGNNKRRRDGKFGRGPCVNACIRDTRSAQDSFCLRRTWLVFLFSRDLASPFLSLAFA